MKVTARKKLPTAKWRLLGETESQPIVRRVGSKILIKIACQGEEFELQAHFSEALLLATLIELKNPALRPKRARRRA